MMISPESFIEEHKNKSYKELLAVWDELMSEIIAFEKDTDRLGEEWMIMPSLEVRYQCNLEYLGRLCQLIADKYNREYVWGEEDADPTEWLSTLRDWLEKKGFYLAPVVDRVKERRAGKCYTESEHLRAMVYSMLRNQRPWAGIQEHMEEIDYIFFDFDVDKVMNADGSTFVEQLRAIKCGNRDIKNQMEALSGNIAVMRKIAKKYGSMDAFVTSAPAEEIVSKLASDKSEYKLKRMRDALVWEYIRNVGIDGIKPDFHICEFFGGDRMGAGNHSPATNQEAINTANTLSEGTGMPLAEIDAIIWSYCADGYGEICTSTPRCSECVIREYCSKQ